jgi:hypothetical protein
LASSARPDQCLRDGELIIALRQPQPAEPHFQSGAFLRVQEGRGDGSFDPVLIHIAWTPRAIGDGLHPDVAGDDIIGRMQAAKDARTRPRPGRDGSAEVKPAGLRDFRINASRSGQASAIIALSILASSARSSAARVGEVSGSSASCSMARYFATKATTGLPERAAARDRKNSITLSDMLGSGFDLPAACRRNGVRCQAITRHSGQLLTTNFKL